MHLSVKKSILIQVNLGVSYNIVRVQVIERNGGPWARLQNTRLRIGNEDIDGGNGDLTANPICFEHTDEPTNNEAIYACNALMNGQFLLFEKFGPTENPVSHEYTWHVNEVNVFAA